MGDLMVRHIRLLFMYPSNLAIFRDIIDFHIAEGYCDSLIIPCEKNLPLFSLDPENGTPLY